MLRIAWLGVLTGAWLLVATPALAQGSRRTSDRQARAHARQAYAQGQALFEEGRFEQAEAAFVLAYGYVPNPVVLLSIAESRQRQGKVTGAIEALEQYLAARPDAPDRADVQAKLEKLKSTPATVAVRTEPAGAAISFDGEDMQKTSPAEIEVKPGRHTLELSLAGHVEQTFTLALEPGGREELDVKLQEVPPPPPKPEVMGAGEGVKEPEAKAEKGEEKGERTVPTGVWVATGVGAAALVTGTVLGFMALHQQSEFDKNPTASTADKGERMALFADVTLGLAAGAAITGLVLYLTEGGEGSKDADEAGDAKATVVPVLMRRGGGLAAGVRF